MERNDIGSWLANMQLSDIKNINIQLQPSVLIEKALLNEGCFLTDTGALLCKTGKFTSRSPKDKFIVNDEETVNSVNWGPINNSITYEHFEILYKKMSQYLRNSCVYVRDVYVGAHPLYRSSIRIINTYAWHDLFCNNLFIRPSARELGNFIPEFTIINIPQFNAIPSSDGTKGTNFTIINISKRIILIGGTGYAGEIKKSVFTLQNYILPRRDNVLPMHCAANVGKDGETAIFFGLSGTGKTTLSTDVNRCLIGDDEHGWCEDAIFNFEGGCYAKTANITKKNEPHIYDAIRFGSVLENVIISSESRGADYSDCSITENTRCAYPLNYIPNAVIPSIGDIPKNIFFLSCDAYGVLPLISKLTNEQAFYYFLSGYTAKIAGTETGIVQPQATFSACFGAAFLPLHPYEYAKMLMNKLSKKKTHVWLINTGWVGGQYGVGKRVDISYTRNIINSALDGILNDQPYKKHEIFGLLMPTTCPNLESKCMDPANLWSRHENYSIQAKQLASEFVTNFNQYKGTVDKSIFASGPSIC